MTNFKAFGILVLMAITYDELMSIAYDSVINPCRPDPGQREKINVIFLFLHFFAVPQKVL